MSNVINFLERMGQDAKLRDADRGSFDQALQNAGIDAQLWSSIVAADDKQREKLLGAASNVCAIIMFGEDEDDSGEPHASNGPVTRQ